MLARLGMLGVGIVLDDFGTGYSSLSYLRLHKFTKIKIDKSFVAELPQQSDCAAIICAITGLARSLGIGTTAEGVETAEQLELLRAAGCDQVQGFLFSRPQPADSLTFDLARRARNDAA
jgi:EAL domain-containing protein (putative c-di-GMP-specific phosphodiesterase class I)